MQVVGIQFVLLEVKVIARAIQAVSFFVVA